MDSARDPRRSSPRDQVLNEEIQKFGIMKTNQWIMAAGITAVLCLGVGKVLSQDAPPGVGGFGGAGRFDPTRMQKMIMDGYRDQLEVTDDADWKAIQDRIQKVVDCQREVSSGGMGMMSRMFRRGAGGNASPQGAPPGGMPSGLASMMPKPSPEEEALQAAIDSKASNAVVKAALAKFLDARKEKQAKLEKAREELRDVLSTRQEAIAALSGLL